LGENFILHPAKIIIVINVENRVNLFDYLEILELSVCLDDYVINASAVARKIATVIGELDVRSFDLHTTTPAPCRTNTSLFPSCVLLLSWLAPSLIPR